jgi:hypothetical protein
VTYRVVDGSVLSQLDGSAPRLKLSQRSSPRLRWPDGLAGVNDAGQVFMRADNSTENPTGRGRKSVRVTSTARLDPKDLQRNVSRPTI